jgi:Chlorophyll A-B binding protein
LNGRLLTLFRSSQYREVKSSKHYMSGGKPGEFPAFDSSVIPGGALNYYDPFGWHKNRSEADKAAGLVKEINNGRLAQLGVFGFFCESKIPGSVPLLSGIIPPYAGDYMAPMDTNLFPF